MKKNFVKQIFIITFLAFLVGCSNSPKLKVNFLSKDKIEIVNNGKKEVTSLRVDVGRFYKDIDSIAPGEKLCFTTKDFIEYRTIKEAIYALKNNEVDETIVPIENSLQGGVT